MAHPPLLGFAHAHAAGLGLLPGVAEGRHRGAGLTARARLGHILTGTALAVWLAAVVWMTARHEVFRDEMRALSIAISAPSFARLPAALTNEGHPIVWYAILRLAYSIVGATVVLKIVSVAIDFSAVTLFLRRAPFPLWQRLLFPWGVLPLYDYAVRARNYGIGMLLMFAFAALYPRRRAWPLLLGLVLALLANTSVHSCILAGLLAALWIADDGLVRRASPERSTAAGIAAGLALAAAGMWFCVATTLPHRNALATDTGALDFRHALEALWLNLRHPGLHFEQVLPGLPPALRDLAVLLLAAGLAFQPLFALLALGAAVLLGTFFTAVYFGALRHQGLWVVFVLVLYWIAHERARPPAGGVRRSRLAGFHRLVATLGLTALFVSHIAGAVYVTHRDFSQGWSSSRAYGRFLRAHAEYREAILVGEPDCFMESLPYYVPNRIYLPREARFGKTVTFSGARGDSLSLGGLLAASQRLQAREGRPVLIALGRGWIELAPRGTAHHSFGKTFTWTPEEVAAFRAATVQVASFDKAVSDEMYDVYALR